MLARFIPRGFGMILLMVKIIRITDTEKFLGDDSLDKFINNTSF